MAGEVDLEIREAGDGDTPALEALVEAAFGGQAASDHGLAEVESALGAS